MPPEWTYNPILLHAMKSWLQSLKWTSCGPVSYCELAIDFELHSGVDLCAASQQTIQQSLSLKQRGKLMGQLLRSLRRLCSALGLLPPHPGSHINRLYCLRPLGVREVWGGLSIRPVFACHEATTALLLTQLPRANQWTQETTWGLDLVPDYSTFTERKQRLAQWLLPLPDERPALAVCDSNVVLPARVTPSKRSRTRSVEVQHKRSKPSAPRTSATTVPRAPIPQLSPLVTSSRKRHRATDRSLDSTPSPLAKCPKLTPLSSSSQLKYNEATGPRSRVVK